MQRTARISQERYIMRKEPAPEPILSDERIVGLGQSETLKMGFWGGHTRSDKSEEGRSKVFQMRGTR